MATTTTPAPAAAVTAPAAPDDYRKDHYFAPTHALPPSPPASVTHDDDYLYTEPETMPSPAPPIRRSSTETDADATNSHIVHLPSPPPTKSTASTHLSPDGHLLPPPTGVHRDRVGDRDRVTRRNTTGSTARQSPPSTTGVLEQDIQLHAEHIRRERNTKRAKLQAQAEAEAAALKKHPKAPEWGQGTVPPTPHTAPPGKPDKEKDDVVLVGNLIGEGHVNYVLMYNMLTGIRIGVSRCQAKIKRPLTEADFKAKHKFSFDIVGNELTPSAKYDFKFKDYAPWIFRSLREDFFHLDPADYLLSLTSKYILSELGSPGKSGSFFYFSRDYRFIIKTIHHAEHAYLLKILPQYYEHIKANPHTLLSRFYGLHRVKLPRGRKIHFVIMNNIFPPHRDIHETYDLKGSTVGREYPEEKARENPRAVLKDLNWINRGRVLELGPEKRALLAEQLRRDSAFLGKVNVMDYSLLVGIHNMQRGNRDNVRRTTLKVFSPHIPHTPRRKMAVGHSHSYSHHSAKGSPEAIAMRRALYRTSDPKRLGDIQLPDAADSEPPATTIAAIAIATATATASTSAPEAAVPSSAPTPPYSPEAQRQPSTSSTSSNYGLTSSYSPHPHRASTHIGTSFPSSSSPFKPAATTPSATTTTTTTTTTATNTNTMGRPLTKTRSRGGGGGSEDKEKDLAEHFIDRQHFMFYQDEGGLRATGEGNDDMDTIYYIGVIDILTPYGGLKKLESFWKGLSADRHKISPVPPAEYADRFLSFMKAVLRGGEGGGRFKAD